MSAGLCVAATAITPWTTSVVFHKLKGRELLICRILMVKVVRSIAMLLLALLTTFAQLGLSFYHCHLNKNKAPSSQCLQVSASSWSFRHSFELHCKEFEDHVHDENEYGDSTETGTKKNSNVKSQMKTKSKATAEKGSPMLPEIKKKVYLGYEYSDEDGTYDVPIVPEPRWYRLNVRKASEKRLAEYFTDEAAQIGGKWQGVILDAFYPQSHYVGFKGKSLELKVKPMIPGLLYVKTKMSPDIADDIERIQGIYGFSKSVSTKLVIPIEEDEAAQIEVMRAKAPLGLPDELKKIKKEDYVSIVGGEHTGRYGIVMGARGGKIEVCLRSEYKDDWDMFNILDLR